MKINIGTEILIILSTPKTDKAKLINTVKITIFSYLKDLEEILKTAIEIDKIVKGV